MKTLVKLIASLLLLAGLGAGAVAWAADPAGPDSDQGIYERNFDSGGLGSQW